jgi:hypothetical protein
MATRAGAALFPRYLFAETPNGVRPILDALAEIKAVTFEPKQTLPAVKRRIAKILLAVRDRRPGRNPGKTGARIP